MSVTSGDFWLLAYAALIVVSAATVLVRREATLVRGGSVFLFTIAYVALAAVVLAWRSGVAAVPARVAIAGVVLLAVTALLAPWWFVLGGPRSEVVSVMEVCFGRVCAQYERVGEGFRMTVPGGGLHIQLHTLPLGRVTVVSFRARPPHRKGELFRRLFVKQYRGALPTIRIRMR
jgi:hypothetical protein